jgi:hypothetical protein
MNERSTLAVALAAALVFAALAWWRHRRAISAGSESFATASAAFNRSAMFHCLAGGTLYFWLLLYLLPASVLVIEAGHNAFGLPLGGFLAGGVLALVVSMVGRYLLRRLAPHAA